MEFLRRFAYSVALTMGIMFAIGILTLLSIPITGGSIENLGHLWATDTLTAMYMVIYGLVMLVALAFVWRRRSRREYMMVPTLAIVGLVILWECRLPTTFILTIMVCYLFGVINWIQAKRDNSRAHTSSPTM